MVAARVAGGIKYKGSGAGESVGLQSEKCGQLDYCRASELVDIGLDAGRCATEIELCVAVVAVVRLGRDPAIEVVTIPKEESARLVGTFEYAVASRVLREKSRALNANF
jgi:hypothetical protein